MHAKCTEIFAPHQFALRKIGGKSAHAHPYDVTTQIMYVQIGVQQDTQEPFCVRCDFETLIVESYLCQIVSANITGGM